ncbi:restriction endonuclease [Pseudomonas sp. QD4]|uniref:restriction endonuclease n=1 Tax=Pseudomonas sp. QD4 TaxID=3368618 RepID=UPI003BA356DA
MEAFTDFQLEEKIKSVQSAIQDWAISNDLWQSTGFQTYAHRVGGEPGNQAVAFIQHFEGHLRDVVDGSADQRLYSEYEAIVESHGFWFENIDGVSVHFYPSEQDWADAFDQYFHWQWVCGLVKEDCGDVHEELYAHFAKRPEDLRRLGHRQFEILLFRIFQNHGFEAELGPGSGDGGVDVRFFQRGPLGDVMTFVQAKKYAQSRKINVEAVAALRGVMADSGVDQGIFVTTSEYLPSARRFAARSTAQIELRTSSDVADWCRDATNGVIADKSKLISDAHVLNQIRQVGGGPDYRIVHASTGYTMMQNSFALVLKESKHAALLMVLPKHRISGDAHGLEGHEVPVLDDTVLAWKTEAHVLRVTREVDCGGNVSYWTGRNLYTKWDGTSQFFSWID